MSNERVKIDQRIVGWSIRESNPAKEHKSVTDGELPKEVSLAYPVPVTSAPDYKRPRSLPSTVYQLTPPEGVTQSALYVTISDIEVDGVRRPVELFFNAVDMQSFQWMTALSRMLSSLLRNTLSVPFPEWIIVDLERVHQPNGNYFIPGTGQQVNSVVHEVGLVLREHCRARGLLEKQELTPYTRAMIAEKKTEAEKKGIQGQNCSACGESGTLYMLDGCLTCVACAYSKCG